METVHQVFAEEERHNGEHPTGSEVDGEADGKDHYKETWSGGDDKLATFNFQASQKFTILNDVHIYFHTQLIIIINYFSHTYIYVCINTLL